VVAGRLAAGSSERTLLFEAGPDYGPADSGRWPDDLLDATSSAQWSHDWGYTGEFECLFVADASLMTAVTSGNTNMPTAVIGERIARSLLS